MSGGQSRGEAFQVERETCARLASTMGQRQDEDNEEEMEMDRLSRHLC